MFNTYIFKDKEILIEAPGNADRNRIKNDLVWDINNFLSTQYDLYMFYVCKKCTDSVFYFPISGFFKKYVAFRKLDATFINRTVLNDKEVTRYREIMDPLKKMDDDVFKEACCLENSDIQYVAIENIDCLLNSKMTFKSITSLNRWIVSSFPIYISLFGAREMRIVVNRNDIREQINAVVLKHCVESV